MKTELFKPTLITQEVIDSLNYEQEYPLLDSVDCNRVSALVKKDWLERRPNCYYILLPVSSPQEQLKQESNEMQNIKHYVRNAVGLSMQDKDFNLEKWIEDNIVSSLKQEKGVSDEEIKKDVKEIFNLFDSENLTLERSVEEIMKLLSSQPLAVKKPLSEISDEHLRECVNILLRGHNNELIDEESMTRWMKIVKLELGEGGQQLAIQPYWTWIWQVYQYLNQFYTLKYYY